MLDAHSRSHRRRHAAHPPFARIVCLVDQEEASQSAIDQAVALAGADAHVVFVSFRANRDAIRRAVGCAQQAGVRAASEELDSPRPAEALLRGAAWHDLIVVGAPAHTRVTGIMLGETATSLVHRSPIPVLVARQRPLADGIVVATRALPADRAALTAATRIAAQLRTELTVVHVPGHGDPERRNELKAELANARALLGRPLDYLEPEPPAAAAIVEVADRDEAGLVVVGSSGKAGVHALGSVSERVAHFAPCSVLVLRER